VVHQATSSRLFIYNGQENGTPITEGLSHQFLVSEQVC